MIMYNPEFYRWVENLSRDVNFRTAISLTSTAYDKRYDMELVSRFLAYRKIDDISKEVSGNLGEFITSKIISIIKDPNFDRQAEEEAFRKIFEIIADSVGDEAFSRYYPDTDKFKGGFSVATYEAIIYGLGINYSEYQTKGFPNVVETIKKLWDEPNFSKNIGSGYNGSFRVARTLPVAKNIFSI